MNTEAPELQFTKEKLENYLNALYGKQVNVYWDVTVRGLGAMAASINWDIGDDEGFGAPEGSGPELGNGTFDIQSPDPGPEQMKIVGAKFEADASINGYIIGGMDAGKNFHSWGVLRNGRFGLASGRVAGTSNVGSRMFWVNGTSKNSTPEDIEFQIDQRLETIAHEIGHLMLNAGHPNKEDAPRVHPLKGSAVIDRLMYQNERDTPLTARRRLLVKGEWDEIEDWLVAEEVAGRIQP